MNAANESPRSDEGRGSSDQPEIILPPFHPQCRFFDGCRIARYADKLKAAGETVALAQLAQALGAATYQPKFPTRLAYCRN